MPNEVSLLWGDGDEVGIGFQDSGQGLSAGILDVGVLLPEIL